MPLPPTSPLGLPQYESTDDFDYADVNNTYERINDLTIPTVCTAGTRPATDLFVGRTIWQTDTEQFYMWDGTKWLLAVNEFFKPMWRGWHTATTSKVSGSSVGVSLTEEYAKEGAFTSAGASNIRTIPVNGVYRITGQATWAAAAGGTRSVDLRKNITGTDYSTGEVLVRHSASPSTTNESCPCASREVPLNAGDTVAMSTLQTSGANLDLQGASIYKTFFEISWLRPL